VFLRLKVKGGLHPKHRLIGYHVFFTDNVNATDTVLDIGCGNGALAFDVAKKAKSVTGIDIETKSIEKAKRKHGAGNIRFIAGDATKDLSTETFDVIILSNVLEHIEDSVGFMKSLKGLAHTYLIRVPMFDRDWVPVLKKEMGIEWRLDLTHYREYTEALFREEMKDAGYTIESLSVQFGEIWAVVKP
jgi:SAM-dependent methyltransferase